MSRKEAKRRIARQEGFILVDAPTIGWNVVRVWWSPNGDFVRPAELNGKDEIVSKGDIENHRQYIAVDTGSASLVDGFVFTQRLSSYLKKHFEKEEVPFILTGAVLFDQFVAKRKE